MLEKDLNCIFTRINTSSENFDADHEAREIQAFVSNFNKNKIKEKDNKIKEKDNKNKELEDEKKKFKLQLTNLRVQNNEVNDKK